MLAGVIAPDDPRADDIRELLKRHRALAELHSPPEDNYVLDLDGLLHPTITLFSYRLHGALLAIAALKQLDERHGEVKSMHTAETARGRGIGMAMLRHVIVVATDRGYKSLSLETGSMAAFAPARSLYTKAGFTPCGPFSDYRTSPNCTFMRLTL